MRTSCLALTSLALFLGYLIFFPSGKEEAIYAAIIESAAPISDDSLMVTARQFREGVNKEFFSPDSPLAPAKLESAQAELILTKSGGELKATEELKDVYLEAGVHKQLQIRSDLAHFNGKHLTLKGHVRVTNEMGDVASDEAIIEQISLGDKPQASKIILSGHVQLVSFDRMRYVLADHVEYYPQEKLMLFEAEKRVFFYDKQKGLQLSAKKVRAVHGEDEEIQGFGDVRFIFGEEELEQLKGHFSWDS